MLLTERIVSLAAARGGREPAGAAALIAGSRLRLPRRSPGAEGPGLQRLVVASLGALRPGLVFAHVVAGGAVEQRQHLVLHRRQPVRDLDPLLAVPLLDVSGVV